MEHLQIRVTRNASLVQKEHFRTQFQGVDAKHAQSTKLQVLELVLVAFAQSGQSSRLRHHAVNAPQGSIPQEMGHVCPVRWVPSLQMMVKEAVDRALRDTSHGIQKTQDRVPVIFAPLAASQLTVLCARNAQQTQFPPRQVLICVMHAELAVKLIPAALSVLLVLLGSTLMTSTSVKLVATEWCQPVPEHHNVFLVIVGTSPTLSKALAKCATLVNFPTRILDSLATVARIMQFLLKELVVAPRVVLAIKKMATNLNAYHAYLANSPQAKALVYLVPLAASLDLQEPLSATNADQAMLRLIPQRGVRVLAPSAAPDHFRRTGKLVKAVPSTKYPRNTVLLNAIFVKQGQNLTLEQVDAGSAQLENFLMAFTVVNLVFLVKFLPRRALLNANHADVAESQIHKQHLVWLALLAHLQTLTQVAFAILVQRG